jgi:1-phosphofructokinase
VIVTVTPNPSLDRTLDVPDLVVGGVNRAAGRHVEPSGKGVNVTRALAINGVESVAVLPSGGPEGEQVLRLLEAESVRYVAVPIREPVRVNITVATVSGVATKINEPGPTLTDSEVAALIDAVLRTSRHGDWVVASGSLPPGVAADFYADLGSRLRAEGRRFALDTSGEALRHGLAGRPEILKPNLEELAEVAHRPLRTLGDVVAAAEDVQQTTGGAVLVSLGAAGAVLVDGEPPLHAQARVGEIRSAVGAGDNALAGFLAAIDAGRDRTAALREAVAWGSAAVRAPGSLAPPVTDVDRQAVRLQPRLDLDRVVSDPRHAGTPFRPDTSAQED